MLATGARRKFQRCATTSVAGKGAPHVQSGGTVIATTVMNAWRAPHAKSAAKRGVMLLASDLSLPRAGLPRHARGFVARLLALWLNN